MNIFSIMFENMNIHMQIICWIISYCFRGIHHPLKGPTIRIMMNHQCLSMLNLVQSMINHHLLKIQNQGPCHRISINLTFFYGKIVFSLYVLSVSFTIDKPIYFIFEDDNRWKVEVQNLYKFCFWWAFSSFERYCQNFLQNITENLNNILI